MIEGLRDGRVAMYSKIHHALIDGVSSMRLMQSVLSTDPDERGMAPTWAAEHVRDRRRDDAEQSGAGSAVPLGALRTALAIGSEAAGLPGCAGPDALARRAQRDVGGVALRPRTIINKTDHRLAPVRRRGLADRAARAIGKASGTTLNDVVLAMCSGAMRTYLDELGELPDTSLVAMVPVGLRARSATSGSAVGRQRRGLGDGPAGHRPGRPGRPAAVASTTRCTRQGGARRDDAARRSWR